MSASLAAHRLDAPVQLLSSALSAAGAGVLAWDAHGAFHRAGGDAGALSCASFDLAGRPLADLLADPRTHTVAAALRAVLDGSADAPAVTCDVAGSPSVVPLLDDGEVAGAALVVRPSSHAAEREVARVSEALERSERDLRHFAYVTSHDLSEPLRVMSGYAEMLGRRYDEQLDDRGRRYIASIVAGAGQMNTLIEALLRYSRARSRSLTCEPVDLDALVGELLANLREPLDERDALVVVDPLPTVTADRRAIGEVLTALIDNAMKFSDEPPRIHVGAHERPDAWEVFVADRGIGIDPGQHERAFELLQRLNAREAYPGTGAGLTVAREMVRGHGGELRVESARGAGSTFSFTLPRAPLGPSATGAAATTGSPA